MTDRIAELRRMVAARGADGDPIYYPHVRSLATDLANALEEIARLREALTACLEWMESGRASGDWGFWDWDEDDEYTKGRAALEPRP